MKLNVGERLAGAGPSPQPGGYVVTGLAAETPWFALYTGKKIFYNFDFTNKRLRETDEAEWVDVFLRTIRYTRLDDPAYVRQRRAQALAEARRVLASRSSNLWPEPLDLLQVPSTHARFAFPDSAGLILADTIAEAEHASAADAHAAEAPAAADLDLEPIVVFARPHGQPLAEWRNNVLPLASLLAVVAELLEFVRQAHAEGLILQLSPSAVLVDRSDRVHYLGADMALPATRSNGLLRATPPGLSAEEAARLFPPERPTRGYVAPELFRAATLPDARTDLYAWAGIAMLLLSGQDLAQIAEEQGRAWAHVQEAHFAALERSLADVPATHVRVWAEQLGIRDDVLLRGWPGNFANLLRNVLHVDPRRRPASVEELLTWIDAPPPAPATAAAAFYEGAEAMLYLDWSGVDLSFDMVVRRGVGLAPHSPADGTLVNQGPILPVVRDAVLPLTPEPIYYAVFTRRNDPGGPVFSPPVVCEVVDKTSSAALVRWAQREAANSVDPLVPPAALALGFTHLDRLFLARALFESASTQVRGWALDQVRRFRHELPDQQVEALLWERLRDPALRHQAARLLLDRPRHDNDVLRMAHILAPDSVDDAHAALDELRAVGADPDQLRRVHDLLEDERPDACPECQVQLTRRERAAHLRDAHGYVELAGNWLPRALAFDRLWDRVLSEGDDKAHAQLLELCRTERLPLANAYVEALEEALARRSQSMPQTPAAADSLRLALRLAPKFLTCLERCHDANTLLGEMVRSPSTPVRALAREGWLPWITSDLDGDARLGETLRQRLELLGPGLLEEKILLCRRLPEVGIDPRAVAECVRRLEADRVVTCVECLAKVRAGDLETHLRRAHGIFQFRGVRRPYADTRSAMLEAASGPRVDEAAWLALEQLARDRHGPAADERLVTWLCQKLRTLKKGRRQAAFEACAEALALSGSGARLLPVLVGPRGEPAQQVLAQMLALEVVCRLPPPVEGALVELVKPLLAARALPRDLRANAVACLLRTTGRAGEAAFDLLKAYVAQSGKLRAIDKLHELESRIGKSPALDLLCNYLEDQVRMNCPRCGLELRRAQMVKHLWDRHRLVLDGRRVREPWRVLEDWVVDYGLEKDAALLARCQDLARRLDPKAGAVLLQRLLLRHGIEDPQARAELQKAAQQRHASLCPYCYAQTPVPELPPLPPLTFGPTTLAGAGFRLKLSERGFFPRMDIDGPEGELYSGREPGRALTRKGIILALIVPAVLLPFLFLQALARSAVPALALFALSLGVGLFLGGLLFLLWPPPARSRQRLSDVAWQNLTPHIFSVPSPEGIEFLGALARQSQGLGRPRVRQHAVAEALQAVRRHPPTPAAPAALFELARLFIEDAQQTDDDVIAVLADVAESCFQGAFPLAVLDLLLEDAAEAGVRGWKRQGPRLQALLLQAAFAAGLELADLAFLAPAYPHLARAWGTNDWERVAQLRLVALWRTRRPWESCGEATTLFEVARDRGAADMILSRTPDLLLQGSRADIALGSRGVWFQNACFSSRPGKVEVVQRSQRGDGYDLVVGQERFGYSRNPRDIANELERWFKFYFDEFLPQSAAMQQRTAGDGLKRLWARNASPCPECRRTLLARLGEVGLREP